MVETITVVNLKQRQTQDEQSNHTQQNLIQLNLKEKLKKNVSWTEDTIDNEHLGKRKSKICCIYHRPRLNPDDPSTDESCSSCDEKGKNAYERPNHYEKIGKKGMGLVTKAK